MTIKVLLVEDSPVALTIIRRIIESAEDMTLVGTARSGVEALELLSKVKPDIVCTDLMMPRMNGLELIHKIMTTNPVPILVISGCIQEDDENNIFQLLEAGAVDIFPKPASGTLQEYDSIRERLLEKIRVIAGVKVFTKRVRPARIRLVDPWEKPVKVHKPPATPLQEATQSSTSPIAVVALAASTGGPQAFQEVLGSLPADFPVPLLCVQHISTGFLKGFLEWLQGNIPLPVVIAKTGEKPQPGKVYFPPERMHLRIDGQGRFYCGDDTPVDNHNPSATVLFETVAHYYGPSAVGVLMTGMGRDGARGLLTLKQKGGYTIAQDESSSIVFGMPQEAIKLGAVHKVLPLPHIAPHLLKLLQSRGFLSSPDSLSGV
ncbi:MAG: chemotaxis-specific protein-glutamate methyltransferase CheB [Geminocystis sp.]|nr:chemotaxis-specific protein-glutamate methyltransferase CheB [Geminocystis sp.]MCX8079160.1 chemotaxis-specific protein-glutamate methyltransferase CheB [Geminocystis sp.]MDW8116726.1 chemotaxis-specific protein-glutamate methyltransferase CheB [Geminocystis sp.]HIK36990.1 chemotaxis-specific protein-glutamate methyltransferase CheB [Geminocystis sp. M7585_C2015_104]